MMDRRTFIGIIASGLAAGSGIAPAQQAGKVWRVGFLSGGIRPTDGAAPVSLRKELQALGFAEGKDVVYESRWAEGKSERLPALAAELIARSVDVIVVIGGPPSAAAKEATRTIPIVVLNAGDVAETGLVASLARPGGNVTGVNDPAALLSAKRRARGTLCRQGPQGGEARRLAGGTAEPVLSRHQPQDRKSAGHCDTAVPPAAGGQGRSIA